MPMTSEEQPTQNPPARDEFLLTLDACETISDALLRALASDSSDCATLGARRDELIARLSATLPVDLGSGELARLRSLLHMGDEARAQAIAAKASATDQLASLQRATQVARQLAATRSPGLSGVDYTG
jgi:hypothetical protein